MSRAGFLLPTTPLPLNSWNPLRVMRAFRPPCLELRNRKLTPEASIALKRRVDSRGVVYCCPHTKATDEANILQLLHTELVETSEMPGATALLVACLVVGCILVLRIQTPLLTAVAIGMSLAAATFVVFLVFTRFVRKLAMSQLQGPTYVADADISDMYESLTLWTVSFLLPLCAVGVHASVDDAHPQM
ncbi:MAG: hypothetical protein KVP17_000136 [Porospora cf. gigantea B]|uniref:uncharacterized protein n=1 Tax=Porospora cf. gigantea B TaxID=2853592 RepID=UPI0035717F42|nr:MAG: hypothetical protein KVP17_000136 [Porospora cf. gigantea B]